MTSIIDVAKVAGVSKSTALFQLPKNTIIP